MAASSAAASAPTADLASDRCDHSDSSAARGRCRKTVVARWKSHTLVYSRKQQSAIAGRAVVNFNTLHITSFNDFPCSICRSNYESTPRTRRVRRVVGHEVARAALAPHVDREYSAAALAATRTNLYCDYRPLVSLSHTRY